MTKTTKTNVVKTMTTSDVAREYNMQSKTLRARIRRNNKKFASLYYNNERHVFRDDAKTRDAIAKLLNA